MVGRIVCSKAGRDKGHLMVAVESNADYVLVCDGKERPLERPKRKNAKHLHITSTVLSKENYKTNKSLKKALAVIRDTAVLEEEAKCLKRT